MTVYVSSQSYKLFDPDHNCRALVADVRSHMYKKGDTVILPAQFMNGTIENALNIKETFYLT